MPCVRPAEHERSQQPRELSLADTVEVMRRLRDELGKPLLGLKQSNGLHASPI